MRRMKNLAAHAAKKIGCALDDRPANGRLMGVTVFETRLDRSNYVAGDEFTIADIAHYGWLWRHEAAGVSLGGVPNVKRWFDAISDRPSVKQAISRTLALAS
jgi:glutathione S-transferase